MTGLGAVVETESPPTRFTAEGEEVELVAVGVLTMGSKEGWVFFVHFDEGGFFDEV